MKSMSILLKTDRKRASEVIAFLDNESHQFDRWVEFAIQSGATPRDFMQIKVEGFERCLDTDELIPAALELTICGKTYDFFGDEVRGIVARDLTDYRYQHTVQPTRLTTRIPSKRVKEAKPTWTLWAPFTNETWAVPR